MKSKKSDTTEVNLNETVKFTFILNNSGAKKEKVRTEYNFEVPGKTDNYNK